MILSTLVKFAETLEENKKIDILTSHLNMQCHVVIYLDRNGVFKRVDAFERTQSRTECIQVSSRARTSGIAPCPIVNNLKYYEIEKRFDVLVSMCNDFALVCKHPYYDAYCNWLRNGKQGYENVRPAIYKKVFNDTEIIQIESNNITSQIEKKLTPIDSYNIIICVEDIELHRDPIIINAWETYRNVGEIITCPLTFKQGIKASTHRKILNGLLMSYTDDDSTDLYITTRSESLIYSSMQYLLNKTHNIQLDNGKTVNIKSNYCRLGALTTVHFTYSSVDESVDDDIASDPFSALLNSFDDKNSIDTDAMERMCNTMKGNVAKFKYGVNMFVMLLKPPASQGRTAIVNSFDSVSFSDNIKQYSTIMSAPRYSYNKTLGWTNKKCIPNIYDIISVTVNEKEDPYKKKAIEFTNAIITSIMMHVKLPKGLLDKVLTVIRHCASTKSADLITYKAMWVMNSIANNINYYETKGDNMTEENKVAYTYGQWFAIQCQIAYYASMKSETAFTIKTNPVYDLITNFEKNPSKFMALVVKKVIPHNQKLSRDMEGLYIKCDKMSNELIMSINEVPNTPLGAYFYIGYYHKIGELMKKVDK